MTGAKTEDRLDRLEKLAEEMFEGIAELRKSQAKIDEQLKELKAAQAKTDEQLNRNDVLIRELRESQAKTDVKHKPSGAQFNRTDTQIRKTSRNLDLITIQLWEQGLIQMEAPEDLFYRNMKGVFRKIGLDLKKVKLNLKRQGQEPYHLVSEGSEVVLVMEVETKLMSKWLVERFINEKLPRFKKIFPEYEKHQVVGGMGALVMKDDVGRYAEKAGLYVLTQTDEGGATLLNQEGFEPKTFN